jgi:hypothetical protein
MWTIAIMGTATLLLISIAMMLSLTQFQETPSGDWVKLAEQITAEFKAKSVSVRVNFSMAPGHLKITYVAGIDSKYDLASQNAEMERMARFAIATYKGKDMKYVTEIRVNRTEVHGSGCFQSTYVSNFTLPVPKRAWQAPGGQPPDDQAPVPGGESSFPPRER